MDDGVGKHRETSEWGLVALLLTFSLTVSVVLIAIVLTNPDLLPPLESMP